MIKNNNNYLKRGRTDKKYFTFQNGWIQTFTSNFKLILITFTSTTTKKKLKKKSGGND